MIPLLLRRLASAVPTLVGITLLAFLILNLLPSDPLQVWSEGGMEPSSEARARILAEIPPDEGIGLRYVRWAADLLQGDLGRSLKDGRPVASVLLEALPWSLLLNFCSIVTIFALAIPFGLLGSWRPGSPADRLGGAALVVLYALPGFAAALLMQQIFAVRLGILPLQGASDPRADTAFLWRAQDLARHLALPTLCLSLSGWAFVARYSRASLRSAMTRSFLAVVRAKGLSRGRASAHALARVSFPFLSLLAVILPGLVGGSVIVEQIFSWPGVGRLYLSAIQTRDYPVVLGLTLVSGTAVLAAQVLVDLLYVLADPSVRDRLLGSRADG